MSPLASYRRLLDLAGPGYVLVAFLGRLPLAMSQLGTLLLVAGSTGSYAAGGISAGALAVANAVGSPVAGAIADRIGQRPVVLVQSLLGSAGLLAVVGLASAGAEWPVQAVVAAATGLAIPQVGPLARVRWRPIVKDSGTHYRRLVDAAFSYEGSADEASFVLGPALVGVATAVLAPAAALLLAAGLLAVFGSLFALHHSAVLARRTPGVATGAEAVLVTTCLVILSAAQFAVGMIFGSAQAATSVLATAAGEPGLTGLLHAVLGVGSVLSGLAVAVLPETVSYQTRLRIFATCLLVLSVPLLAVDSLGSLAGSLLVLGLAIAPYMISVFTLTERLTPPHRTGAAMTVLAGATGIGYAVGSSVAGRLADWGGHTPAFAVTVVAGGLASVLAWSSAPRLRAEQQQRADEQVA
ncbi:MAG TPA: MFS transporter [Nocardioidaceae bacterium]|nr:MFS transporter [Nocardioidaceae bacterium]